MPNNNTISEKKGFGEVIVYNKMEFFHEGKASPYK